MGVIRVFNPYSHEISQVINNTSIPFPNWLSLSKDYRSWEAIRTGLSSL